MKVRCHVFQFVCKSLDVLMWALHCEARHYQFLLLRIRQTRLWLNAAPQTVVHYHNQFQNYRFNHCFWYNLNNYHIDFGQAQHCLTKYRHSNINFSIPVHGWIKKMVISDTCFIALALIGRVFGR